MDNQKNVPYTYGTLSVFLGVVCVSCGIAVKNSNMTGAGIALAVIGAAWLLTLRARRDKSTETTDTDA